jgi:hypothetical protein
MTQRAQELGFVITPSVIADRVAAINRSVAALDSDISKSGAPRLDAPWRAEWSAFVRRWVVERDSRASWTSRLFAWEAMPRIDAYQATYNWWARSFQERAGTAPTVPAPAEVESMTMSIVPTPVWWVAGAAVAYWVITKRGFT